MVGKELLRVRATDNDSTTNALLNYYIESGNDIFTFFINEAKGSVFLAKEVDYENVTRFRLVIGVRDRGSPSRKVLISSTVDIAVYDDNDNPPRFNPETYDVTVYENVTSGTYLCTVYAEDKDSHINQEVKYFMASYSQPKAKQKFEVNGSTGEIFTREELDREEQQVSSLVACQKTS